MRSLLSRPRVLASLVLLCLAAPLRAEELTVRVLHTTDLHGALVGWDDVRDQATSRGLERIASGIAAARADGTPTLLVDVGDALSGSSLVRAWREGDRSRPEPMVAAMNRLGYDALAVGNHEFDGGRAALDSARARARFPFLAANVLDARTRQPAFGTSLVRDMNGARIGIVGVTSPALPMLMDTSLCAGLVFVDPIETARREVARLRSAERCAAVIVLFHSGLERDPAARGGDAKPRLGDAPNENLGWRLAYEVPGIDVLVLGHTHQVVPGAAVGGAIVTQAGRNGEALGRVELRFTRPSSLAPWTLAGRTSAVRAVNDSLAVDPELQSFAAPYLQAARTLLESPVAQAAAPLAAPAGRFADNALLQLIHRTQLTASGADVSLATMFEPAQVIAAGPVRRRDLLRLYPYDNTLGMVTLTGAELIAVLEHAAAMLTDDVWNGRADLLRPGVAGYQFDTAMGVDYTIDLTRPVGSRITNVTRAGRPLDPSATLKVVANSYRLAGGGDYLELRRAPQVWRSRETMPELLLAYVSAQGMPPAATAANWSLQPSFAGAPERAAIDRLVRLGALSRREVLTTDGPVSRLEVMTGLARAFALRGKRATGAWGDVPDSVARALDGLAALGVLGPRADRTRLAADGLATAAQTLDWCERTARALGYALTSAPDAAFRRGLLVGVSGADALTGEASVSRVQWLAILANLRFPTVRLLETTDFHGAILGGNKDRRTQRPVGGSVALAAAIARERAVNPEGTVLLDGGDLFQGTMISNLQYGRPVVEQMNALGYAAAAVGNHEFDWGVDTLAARVHGMRFAALGANMVERRTNKLPKWARSDTTVRRRGVRVGIVGLAYPGTPRVTLATNVAHLRFDDDSTTAARVSQRLRREGAMVVVGVGHIPAETDSSRRAKGDLARLGQVATVDAWLGGHSHNVVDDRMNGRPVLIAGAQGQWLAVVDLVVDPLIGKVVESTQRIDQVWADGPVDSTWTARVARWNEAIGPISATVLGRAAVPLHRRRPESTIGDFICDAMRAEVKADIAMQNPGGMRADHEAGPITRGTVYAVMPFDNSIVTLQLNGALVKLALEQALANDRITQVSGIRYTFDPSRPALSRITEITLADGRPLEPAQVYRVAVNNFMATGGDHYDALTQGTGRDDTGRLIRDAMEAWVRAQCAGDRALEMRGDGRIRNSGGNER